METKQEQSHAQQNAQGWTETIAGMVGALECDYERLEELRGMDAGLRCSQFRGSRLHHGRGVRRLLPATGR